MLTRAKTAERFHLVLAAVTVLALGVRLAYALAVAPHASQPGDSKLFQFLAYSLTHGQGYSTETSVFSGHPMPTAEHPPLYVLYLALFTKLGLGTMNEHRALSCLLGAAAVALIGLLGRRVAGPRVGLIAAAVAAVYPQLAVIDGTLISESLYAPLIVLSVLLAYRLIDRPGPRRAALLGGVIGLATLTRPDGLLLLLLLAAPVLWLAGRGQRLPVFAACGLTFVLVLSPWLIRNQIAMHRFPLISTNGALTLPAANCDITYYGRFTGFVNLTTCAEQIPKCRGIVNEIPLSECLEHTAVNYMHSPQAAGANRRDRAHSPGVPAVSVQPGHPIRDCLGPDQGGGRRGIGGVCAAGTTRDRRRDPPTPARRAHVPALDAVRDRGHRGRDVIRIQPLPPGGRARTGDPGCRHAGAGAGSRPPVIWLLTTRPAAGQLMALQIGIALAAAAGLVIVRYALGSTRLTASAVGAILTFALTLVFAIEVGAGPTMVNSTPCRIVNANLTQPASCRPRGLAATPTRVVGRSILLSNGARLAIVPLRIRGSIDQSLSAGNVFGPAADIAGWAADVRAGRPASAILVFSSGRFVGAAAPAFDRPDVANVYHDAALRLSGFRLHVPLSAPPGAHVRMQLFAVSAGVASPLALQCTIGQYGC